MRELVEESGRHFRVTEDAGPFAEGEIGRDDDRRALVMTCQGTFIRKTVCPSAAGLLWGGSPYTGGFQRGLLEEQSLKPGGRTGVENSELFIGLDVSQDSHAVAVAEGGRDGEVRPHGEIGSDAASVRRLVRKLERPGLRLRFCYEAGPTGYGLKRLIEELGHECAVIAPSLIPRRPGERIKTNRRDAVKLARLFRAGELTEIWTPDEAHEAMRDLVRAREAAVKDRTRKRQEIRSFLLRIGKVYPGKKA